MTRAGSTSNSPRPNSPRAAQGRLAPVRGIRPLEKRSQYAQRKPHTTTRESTPVARVVSFATSDCRASRVGRPSTCPLDKPPTVRNRSAGQGPGPS